MSGTSRKVKNPLLSAAGPGFPFENYTENALLVPVTPATNAVQDGAELDNFVGQESVNVQSQTPTRTYENSPTSVPTQTKEIKDTVSQPTKQGYFTSILSSLPNLSLSSSKTDSPESQISQASEDISRATFEHNSHIAPQGHHSFQPELPGFLAINPQDSGRTDLSGFASSGSAGTLPNPTQPVIPPNLPQSRDAPVSYRLGNQRRLKYAPPPDLTSNNAKPYPNPTIQTFFPIQNASAIPTILNPYESERSIRDNNSGVQQISSLSEQSSISEQLSRNSSLHGSFRSSPVATGTTYNSSITSTCQSPIYENSSVSAPPQFTSSSFRSIPSRVPEPATPQNTPANVSFPGFTPYVNRDFIPGSNLDKDVTVLGSSNQLTSSSEFSKDNISDSNIELAHKSLSISEESNATFTPISAAKLTDKLEHLLAEQKETSSIKITTVASSEVDEITSNIATELTQSSKPQSETLQHISKSIDNSCEAKLNDVQEKTDHLRSHTLCDVFLGQEPAKQSITYPEVHTSDNSPVITDIQTSKSNTHPSQQYYQIQTTPVPSSTFYANNPENQKSSLNYVAPVQVSQQNSSYNLPRPAVQSASAFFESTTHDTGHFPAVSSQQNNPNTSFNQLISDTTSNSQQNRESSFSFPVIGSTAHAPFWNADQSSQSQPLTVSNQPAAPIFYNPAEFANIVSKQSTLSNTYGQQHTSQQQLYQDTTCYGNISGLQQSYVARGNNIACSSPVVPMATAIPESTGLATLSPVQMSVNSPTNRTTSDTVPPSFQNWASGSSDRRMQYRAMYYHWFYRKEIENKTLWLPFSMQDSLKLEEIHNSSDIMPETTVATDGGRYDVDILRRQRKPVYWTGACTEVRRCSWFYKGATESRYVPYDESTAVKLEEEYKQSCLANNWNRKIELNNGEHIVFHSATVQVHYLQPNSPESGGSWGGNTSSEDSAYLQGTASRPRVVKRGVDEFTIDEGEPEKVDHLLFLVHGIGSVCDLKFRTVEEVVDEFRSISLQLVQSHYRTASEQGIVNRIEVLPISWHATLHSEDTGIDKKLQAITLESIPKLRHFANDTLLDVLFYTSPMYCQTIMQTVGSEMNRLHSLFKERNPSFAGNVYLGGHSLGSLILFDLLCHQKVEYNNGMDNENDDASSDRGSENDSVGPIKPMPAPILRRRLSRRISYVMGAAGTGQPYIHYPQLNFQPRAFFALGSPIGMFVTVRGIDTLGDDFALPTCPAFFNIFHPFDPVAYRMESLINPDAYKFRPMLIPHHKGRKRMHLELKETMARVGADLKQKLLDSVKSTWNSVYQLALFHKSDNQALEREIDKVVEEQLQNTPSVSNHNNDDASDADLKIGQLNGGRRVDYVLQEAPFEYINEYIFALTSHICYWESEDTMLLILKEIYSSMGIQTDAQLPQQTMSIERASPSSSLNLSPATSPSKSNAGTSLPVGVDPTAPMSGQPVGPPPIVGFVRKT